MWPSKKENKKPNCSITFSYRRKKKRKHKLFWGENWKNKPYLKRRLLDHLGFISKLQVCLAFSFSSSLHPISLQSLPLFISPSLLIRSLSSSHQKTAPSALLLHSPFLHFFIPSLFNLSLSSISPSLQSPFFPFPISLHPSTRKLPLLLFAYYFFYFLFKSKGRSLDLELIFMDKMGFINFFIN